MGNLRPSVFGLIKMLIRVPKKRSAKIFGKEITDLRFSGNGQKCLTNFEKTQVPLDPPRITEQIKIL